ncbi:MAG: hypothetical protein AAGJ93_14155 [Bacteroidota bacterium]
MRNLLTYSWQKKYLALLVAGLASFCMHYKSGKENRIRKQMRLYNVTLDSKLFVRETQEKQPEEYLYFRTKEYPRLTFNISGDSYDLLNKELLLKIDYGDTLGIWIKNDLEAKRQEREVYGIETAEKTYLYPKPVLSRLNSASRKGNGLLFVLTLIALVYYLVIFFRQPKI